MKQPTKNSSFRSLLNKEPELLEDDSMGVAKIAFPFVGGRMQAPGDKEKPVPSIPIDYDQSNWQFETVDKESEPRLSVTDIRQAVEKLLNAIPDSNIGGLKKLRRDVARHCHPDVHPELSANELSDLMGWANVKIDEAIIACAKNG